VSAAFPSSHLPTGSLFIYTPLPLPQQQLEAQCSQFPAPLLFSGHYSVDWGLSTRSNCPSGCEVAFEALWEGAVEGRRQAAWPDCWLCECGRLIVPQLYSLGLDGADLETLIRASRVWHNLSGSGGFFVLRWQLTWSPVGTVWAQLYMACGMRAGSCGLNSLLPTPEIPSLVLSFLKTQLLKWPFCGCRSRASVLSGGGAHSVPHWWHL
jgi:hypothetical protein